VCVRARTQVMRLDLEALLDQELRHFRDALPPGREGRRCSSRVWGGGRRGLLLLALEKLRVGLGRDVSV
jgi:hypothetical protein